MRIKVNRTTLHIFLKKKHFLIKPLYCKDTGRIYGKDIGGINGKDISRIYGLTLTEFTQNLRKGQWQKLTVTIDSSFKVEPALLRTKFHGCLLASTLRLCSHHNITVIVATSM